MSGCRNAFRRQLAALGPGMLHSVPSAQQLGIGETKWHLHRTGAAEAQAPDRIPALPT